MLGALLLLVLFSTNQSSGCNFRPRPTTTPRPPTTTTTRTTTKAPVLSRLGNATRCGHKVQIKDVFEKVCVYACTSCRYADMPIYCLSEREFNLKEVLRVQNPGFQLVMVCSSKKRQSTLESLLVQGRERIVGGNLTADGEIPWQCSLLQGNDR